LNLGALFVEHIGLGSAFLAGMATFFTPCVLPLIPAWLVLVTGLNFEDMAAPGSRRSLADMFWPTLFFVLGFTAVFTLLGAAAGYLGGFLQNQAWLLRTAAGLIMIFFGASLAGFISPAFLNREKRVTLTRRPLGLAGAFVVGLGFAAGWTPCVGPVLASILALAAAESSAGEGARLLAVYSLGLGLPFLVMTGVWGQGMAWLARIRPLARRAGLILGLGLMALGLLVLTGRLNLIIS
jgi:cytochrome c-type biogenesis protein